jgi:hypothetical protein
MAPFCLERERSEYPNDHSVETVIRITAFYRRIEFSYSRPMTVSPSGKCYSDHNEDILTKGSCDYCGGQESELHADR